MKKRDEEKGTGVTTKNEDEERGEREEERNLTRRRRDEIEETLWYEWNTRGNEKGRAVEEEEEKSDEDGSRSIYLARGHS